MTKTEYGLLFEAIEKHCKDIFKDCFVQPENNEKPKIFITPQEFVRMLSASIDRDKSLPDPT